MNLVRVHEIKSTVKAGDKPRAYSYVRFSSAEQQKGDSLRRQLEWSRRFASEHDLELDEQLTFRDLGVSAWDKSNLAEGRQLREFLDAVDSGRVLPGSWLLVESLDRLSRAGVNEASRLQLDILNRGITIATKEMVYEPNPKDQHAQLIQILIGTAINFRAVEESNTKSDRLRNSWQEKRLNAGARRMTSQCPGWLRPSEDGLKFEEIPEHVALLRKIIAMIQSGLGKGAITKSLNKAGIPSFGGRSKSGTWFASYITKILRNKALIGELQPYVKHAKGRRPEGEPIPAYYPRIISDEEFALLQDLIDERGTRRGGNRGKNFANLFTGLIKCGYCNSSMVYVDKGIDKRRRGDSSKNRFLVCHTAKRGAGCHYVPWTYSEFEEAFFRHATKTDFRDFVRNPDTLTAARRARDELIIVQARRKEVLQRRERLVDAISSATQRPNGVLERILVLEEELLAADRRIEELEVEISSVAQRQHASEEAIAALHEITANMSSMQGENLFLLRAKLNEHLRRVVERIGVYPGGSVYSMEDRNEIKAELLRSGRYEEKVVEQFVLAEVRLQPRKHERYFAIRNKRQSIQIIRPDDPIPDIFEVMSQHPGLWHEERLQLTRKLAQAFGESQTEPQRISASGSKN